MRIGQIAATTYTLREFMKTPADIATSLEKVKRIGYPAVQLSGLGPIGDAELAKLLRDTGLTCCATHDGRISDPMAMVAKLNVLDCRHTAYPGAEPPATIEGVRALAQRLNAAGKVLQEAGITLSYHNHSGEFVRRDGRLVLDLLYEETDPRYLQAEIDTYWVQYGGGDPEDWCRKLVGRLPLLHMKDYAVNEKSQPMYAEIGYGNLTWKPIVAAADAAGCQWYIVEQDVCAGDPFDSLRMSFEYIRDNLCTG